jgi:NAD+ kinase
MRFGIVCNLEDPSAIESVRKVIEALVKKKHRVILENGLNALLKTKYEESSASEMHASMILAIGDSSTVLKAFRDMGSSRTPVLGISCGNIDFLTEIDIKNFERFLIKIENKEYFREERARLNVFVNGDELPHALNDVVISSLRGSVLMRYALKVNSEAIWRDTSDGIIVASPTGSTGYSLSSGGPIVSPSSKVFVISPICSMENKKPFVINDENEITLTDISSPEGCEIAIDGRYRMKMANNTVKINKSRNPAVFVKFDPRFHSYVFHKLLRQGEDLNIPKDAPPSAKFIIKLLQYEGPLTQKEIISSSMLPARTVRSALSYLVKKDLVKQKISVRDVRQSLYSVNS